MTVPDIPENSLTKHINKLISICQKLCQTDYVEDDDAFIFNPPANISDIELWEENNKVKIPSSYKDWLLFSNGTKLCNSIVELYSLENFIVNNDLKPYNVPDEFIVIGESVVEEVYGFSVETGKFMIFGEYEDMEATDFSEILEWVTDILYLNPQSSL